MVSDSLDVHDQASLGLVQWTPDSEADTLPPSHQLTGLPCPHCPLCELELNVGNEATIDGFFNLENCTIKSLEMPQEPPLLLYITLQIILCDFLQIPTYRRTAPLSFRRPNISHSTGRSACNIAARTHLFFSRV